MTSSSSWVVLCLAFGAACAQEAAPPVVPEPPRPPAPPSYSWKKLETVAYKGKQDDIYFVTPELGFYVNGAGKIYKTTDGGARWVEKLGKPGTYFRAIAFIDEKNGFAGNIGTDYFPGVTDTTPLYETHDGGETWSATTPIQGAGIKGLCALDVLRVPFINAGQLDYKVVLHAAGRVGGPAVLATSTDLGKTWTAVDMNDKAGMILDVKFLDAKTGFLCAATKGDVERSNALILKTTDGGTTWTPKYQSARPYENVWKCAFPTHEVGYATVQSYDPDKTTSKRYVAKTTDGGETWSELPLVDDYEVREFGVGFIDTTTGWVGAAPHGFQTTDGGRTWTATDFGKAVNKIRLLPTPGGGFVGYAIGVDVYKLTSAKGLAAASR
jgi:photosystem II stability/assembly factor-like uncharacterized protein